MSHEERLDDLDILVRKMGHDPKPWIRPGRYRMDAFRCKGCGQVNRLGDDEDGIEPCLWSPEEISQEGEQAA